jgi:excisionase family DNA binding protein
MVTGHDQSIDKKRATGPITDSRSVGRLLDLKAAGKYLSLSYWTVRRMINQGEIAYIRAGRKILVDVRDLDRWIEDNKLSWR